MLGHCFILGKLLVQADDFGFDLRHDRCQCLGIHLLFFVHVQMIVEDAGVLMTQSPRDLCIEGVLIKVPLSYNVYSLPYITINYYAFPFFHLFYMILRIFHILYNYVCSFILQQFFCIIFYRK